MTGNERLSKTIEADYGERCPDFHPDCICCQIWRAYDELVAAKPTLTDDDQDMAMHWIDRFAAGIDAYPQLDRIARHDAA